MSRLAPLSIVLGALILCGGLLFALQADGKNIASRIVSDCSGKSDHAACYEAEVPQLYPKLSVPDIFTVVRQIRTVDPTYQFCHVLAHKIGERVVDEGSSQWVDAIALNPPNGLCSNGFIHGVIGGRFRAEVLSDATIQTLMPDFIRACVPRTNWQPSDLDRAICYHGMGHLFDFITNVNIPKALNLCSQVAPEDFARTCVQGVFMQIYQPLEPDDYALINQMQDKPATSTVRSYCAQFKEPIYEGSCLEESWPFVRADILDGSGVRAFCSGYPNSTEESFCWQGASTILGRMSLGDPEAAAAACNKFPSNWQALCFTDVAQAVLEEDRTAGNKAVALCRRASQDIATECMTTLASHAGFIFGPDKRGLGLFCALLPSDVQPSCVAP